MLQRAIVTAQLGKSYLGSQARRIRTGHCNDPRPKCVRWLCPERTASTGKPAMRPAWTKIILALAGLWLVVGGSLWWLDSRKPTAEKVVQYVETHPLDGKSEAERRAIIERVAEQVNQLDPEERHQARPHRSLEEFWRKLTAAEKGHYFELVVPRGLQMAIENFNKMEPARRKREIEKAVKRLREDSEEALPEDFDPQLAKKFVDEGLRTFYSEGSIEAKMDALPLLEELEKSFKWRRN